MFKKIIQFNCQHLREDIYLETLSYNSPYITTTLDNERQIKCGCCGKILVTINQMKLVEELTQ